VKRLAIVTTHPIQYNAPFFRLLAERKQLDIKVFYTWGVSVLEKKYDPGFGRTIEWDIPLLQGYEYCFTENIAAAPGSHSFKGIDNPGLITEIENWGADAVLIYGWSFNSHLRCMRYFKNKIPVLFRGDSTLLDEQSFFKKKIRSFFLKWVYSHIDYALYAGTNNKKYFSKCGVTDSKLVFAPHAIDNSRFADDASKQYETKALQWRKELRINETDTVFLFAGKLEEKKNPVLLVDAFLQLKQPGVKLVIAGNGPLETALKSKANGSDAIKFIGFQNQSVMPVLYRVSDCVVLPSKGPNETWGLAVNEAMACSRPVIVSNKCGCAIDLIQDGKTGYVFESGNLPGLINKMTAFVQTKNDGIKMGSDAATAIQPWNFFEICKKVEQLTV
jgi:glycosyltransferase involved in cell wall biosynthesis